MEDVVHVVMFNRRTRFIGNYPRDEIQKYFRYRPDNFYFMPRYREFHKDPETGEMVRRWDGYIRLLRYGKVGTGLFLSMKDTIEKETGLRFDIDDRRRVLKYRSIEMNGARPYQQEGVRKMQQSISGGVILAATRSGKTMMAGLYFKSMSGGGVFIVDELHLLKQARKELEDVIQEPVGEIGEMKFDPKRVTVATVQTLHKYHQSERFRPWTKSLKAMFIDELHVQLNKRNFDIVTTIKPRLVFGMTATLELKKEPVRLRALDLCGPVVFEYGLEKGIEEGYLTPGVVVSVEVRQEDNEIMGYQEAYRELIVDSKERNQVITNLVTEAYNQGRNILVLTERIHHLKILSRLLTDIPHEIVYGAKTATDRIQTTKNFDQGDLRLILANKVFKKGITIRSVDTMIDGSALRSKNDAIQKFGRGIGLCKGKSGLIYFDISDRSMEGISTQDRRWNRFEKSTKSRLKAFRDKNIPIQKVDGEMKPSRILDLGKELLQRKTGEKKKGPKALSLSIPEGESPLGDSND